MVSVTGTTPHWLDQETKSLDLLENLLQFNKILYVTTACEPHFIYADTSCSNMDYISIESPLIGESNLTV